MNEHVIVALVATKGLEDFLENSLTGLARVGVDPRIVHVARPDNAADTIDPIVLNAGAVVHSFGEFGQSSPNAMPERYVDYGTEPFIAVNWEKVRYIRWLLDRYRHVVYADLDIGWLADPLWYLDAVAKFYPLAFQTEGLRRFPPLLCWGFLSTLSSNTTLRLLDAMLGDYDARPAGQPQVDEQNTLDAMIAKNPGLLGNVYLLPEALFVNGIGYRHLLSEPAVAPLQGTIEPFVFHANWTVGLANKRKLMTQTGTWLLDTN
ncbi:putative nucleotide-diphospho-sugar transferase [Bradyrhizobium sp. LjRoot220]|uniref:putative nucleotide-diphospho-sugar transferase n=1 Tax=Bradyrhizobium sp. LjRoot220 TaxID=3342284 RepID=UPI003ECC30C5